MNKEDLQKIAMLTEEELRFILKFRKLSEEEKIAIIKEIERKCRF